MNIVLFNPQIPQNTGNIVRTCSATGTRLFLVPPLGFSISDRALKRAGLDYWEGVSVEIIENFEMFLKENGKKCFFFSSKGETVYTKVKYQEGDYLVFGSETEGLPNELHEHWKMQFVQIPMRKGKRCLNLATSVGIGLYEAIRQIPDFSCYTEKTSRLRF